MEPWAAILRQTGPSPVAPVFDALVHQLEVVGDLFAAEALAEVASNGGHAEALQHLTNVRAELRRAYAEARHQLELLEGGGADA